MSYAVELLVQIVFTLLYSFVLAWSMWSCNLFEIKTVLCACAVGLKVKSVWKQSKSQTACYETKHTYRDIVRVHSTSIDAIYLEMHLFEGGKPDGGSLLTADIPLWKRPLKFL